MKILMTGSTGLVGNALTRSLFAKGYQLQSLHHNKKFPAASGNFWNSKKLTDDFQAVIHLAGENIASGRWNAEKKRAISQSRIKGTQDLVNYIARMKEKPKIFLSASAVGYYGNRDQEFLHEKSSPGSGFLSDLCQKWEKEAKRLEQWGIRVVHLRFGMILAANGGALQKMLPPFRKMVGGVAGSGDQYISWISIHDVVEIIEFILRNNKISGPVNITSPTPVTNREFTRTLAKELRVPAVMNMPAFAIKMIFGEMGKELLLSGTKALPKVLLQHGYNFTYTDLGAALRDCINGERK